MRYRDLGLSDFSMLHGADKEHPHGGVVVTEFIDQIEPCLMRSAIDKAMQRFPYWLVTLHKGFTDVWFERNTNEVVLAKDKLKMSLGGKEANGHLLAFSYIDNKLLLHFSHILLDGFGLATLLRTIILYYCQLRYDKNLTNADALTFDTPMSEDELRDPLSSEIPQDLPKKSNPKIPQAFRPDWQGLVNVTTQQVHHISISSEQVDDFCNRYSVTPPVMIDVLFARALHSIHPDVSQPIISGMPASVRRLTGCQQSMLNATIPLRIVHNAKFWQMSLEQQLAEVRKQIKAQTEPCVMWTEMKALVKLFKMLRCMPDFLRAFIMPRAFAKAVAINSYDLSFTGRMRLNETNKYVKSCFINAAYKGSGMMMQMLSLDNCFCISYCQEWQDTIYLNRFLRELEEVGFSVNHH